MGRTYRPPARAAPATCMPWSFQASLEKMPAKSPLAWTTPVPPLFSESNVRTRKPLVRLLKGWTGGPEQEGDQMPVVWVGKVHPQRWEGGGSVEQGSGTNPAFVSGIKHNPPGPPVLAEMFKGRKNMVLLTWKPPEPVPETPFVYRLERQKVGSEDWVQCFSMENAGAVELSGDCVPSEGDYRFRICTVSEHGRSPHVVFHGSARLGEWTLPDLACQQRHPKSYPLLPSAALGPCLLKCPPANVCPVSPL